MEDSVMSNKPSSIKVARNAKGQYTFEVKTYYDEDFRKPKEVVEQNKAIMAQLLEEFV